MYYAYKGPQKDRNMGMGVLLQHSLTAVRGTSESWCNWVPDGGKSILLHGTRCFDSSAPSGRIFHFSFDCCSSASGSSIKNRETSHNIKNPGWRHSQTVSRTIIWVKRTPLLFHASFFQAPLNAALQLLYWKMKDSRSFAAFFFITCVRCVYVRYFYPPKLHIN